MDAVSDKECCLRIVTKALKFTGYYRLLYCIALSLTDWLPTSFYGSQMMLPMDMSVSPNEDRFGGNHPPSHFVSREPARPRWQTALRPLLCLLQGGRDAHPFGVSHAHSPGDVIGDVFQIANVFDHSA